MSYYRFTNDDIFINGIETHPANHFYIYSGSVFYRNTPNENATLLSGTTLTSPSASVLGTPVGSLNLYELNVNRPAILQTWDQQAQTGVKSLIFPWVVKGSDNIKWKTLATASYSALEFGTVVTASYKYPLSASLSREFYPENHLASAATPAARKNLQLDPGTYNAYNTQEGTFDDGGVTVTSSYIEALKNTLDYYTHVSDQYAFTASTVIPLSPTHADYNLDTDYTSTPLWDKGVQKLNLINIPSMYYGSAIQKGSVDLRFYITGTLQGRCQDLYQNGNLVETFARDPNFDADNPRIAGVVLYNEGFVLLTGSWPLSHRDAPYEGAAFAASPDTLLENPRWIYWGVGLTSSLNATGPSGETSQSGSVMTSDGNALYGDKSGRYDFPSASFEMIFSGTHTVPVMTMMTHAPKGELYWSNNPSFTAANITGSQGPGPASVLFDLTNGADLEGDTGATGLVVTDTEGNSVTFSLNNGILWVDSTATAIGTAGLMPGIPEVARSRAAHSVWRSLKLAAEAGTLNIALSPDPRYLPLAGDLGQNNSSFRVSQISPGTAGNRAITGQIITDSIVLLKDGAGTSVSGFTGGGREWGIVSRTGYGEENIISGSVLKVMSGSTFYQEDPSLQIKNINSSSFPNATASFEKITYISKIGIYDKQKNLIGIAKVARPLKKEITQDFTFKLKLDL